MKPNVRFLLSDPAHFVVLGFGSGLWPKGPGTAGTLAGWLLFPLVRAPLTDGLFAGLLGMFLVGGIAGAAGFKYVGFVFVVPLALVLFTLALPPLWIDRARLRMPGRRAAGSTPPR